MVSFCRCRFRRFPFGVEDFTRPGDDLVGKEEEEDEDGEDEVVVVVVVVDLEDEEGGAFPLCLLLSGTGLEGSGGEA